MNTKNDEENDIHHDVDEDDLYGDLLDDGVNPTKNNNANCSTSSFCSAEKERSYYTNTTVTATRRTSDDIATTQESFGTNHCATETLSTTPTRATTSSLNYRMNHHHHDQKITLLQNEIQKLTKENKTLKRNMGTLYRTAKVELERKDLMIANLEQQLHS